MTFQLGIQLVDDSGQPVTLTGCSAHLQVREDSAAPGLLADWSTSGDNPVITLDETAKRLMFYVDGATIGAYTWRYGVFDLLVTSANGTSYKVLEGEAEIEATVTVS